MNSPLGIFDSGIGGFTVLRSVVERHGDIPCLYLGDTERIPYGDRPPAEIRIIANEISQWFSDQNVSAILVACNTTNSLALDVVERVNGVQVFSLIKAAVQMIFEDRVGVLATSATSASSAYRKQIQIYRPGTIVLEQACPAFVPLIEKGDCESDELRVVASEYLKPLIEARVEAIVLGCSHYPLLGSLLQDLLPKGVRLIDPAIGLAADLDRLLGSPKAGSKIIPSFSNTRFCVTSDSREFGSRVNKWLGGDPEVELISLRSTACLF